MYTFRFALLGIIFSIAYVIFAMGAAGFGHGTYLFFIPAWPYGLGLLVYPVLFHLLSLLENYRTRWIFVCVALLHYATIALLLSARWSDEASYVQRTLSVEPLNVVLPVVWFFAGQIVLWICFTLKIKSFESRV